jgi:iron complex transport system substrate-binding protein
LLLACLIGGCGYAAEVEPAVDGAHPAIVSLNPCSDAILVEVADPAQILAISHYSHDPGASSMELAVARQFPATGGTVEEVLALEPDVVIAGGFLQPSTRSAFERLGIRVETLGIASTVDQSEAQVRQLAQLAGYPERGDELVSRIENALAAANRGYSEAPAALVWQQGGLVAGPDSLIAELLVRTGFASHAAARGLGQGDYLPLEAVLADPPDLILAAGSERALAHPALSALPHTASHKLDPSLLFCGGPTIIRAVERLAEIRLEIDR